MRRPDPPPLAPVLGGEGPGVRGFSSAIQTPHPQPLSPEYRGEGLPGQTLNRRPVSARMPRQLAATRRAVE